AQERPPRARGARRLGDVLGVGRDDDVVAHAPLGRRLDRRGDQRLAGERLDLLAGQALPAAACRDDAENVVRLVAHSPPRDPPWPSPLARLLRYSMTRTTRSARDSLRPWWMPWK